MLELQRLERFLARRDCGHLDVVAGADQLDERAPLVFAVLDDEQTLDVAVDEGADRAERLVERLLRHRLLDESDCAGAQSVLAAVSG